MRTETLLRVGVVAPVVFTGVLFIEGARRPGYDPTYHTGSALSLGDRGWIQRANFVQLGVGMVAFAVGVRRTLDDAVGAGLLAIFGLGMVASGVFVPDPMRGYPPGTPAGNPAEVSRRHQVHDLTGPVAFLALLGACLRLSRRLHGGWQLYTIVTAVAGLALTVWTAAAWQRDARNTGLVQRGLIVVYLSWIILLGTHLVKSPRAR